MRDFLFLYVNGEPLEVRGRAAFQTLAGYLRSERHATGTKIVCDEGDCGACTVLIGRPERGRPIDRLVYRPVNACIQHVYQADGAHVVTVEGLAHNGALSRIQESMIVHHGAQCGFCTPGFITALTALYEDGEPLADQDVRDGLTGNLCRCTGYDPITQAALAVDPTQMRHLNDLYPPTEISHALSRFDGMPVHIEFDGRAFASPSTVDEAVHFLGRREGAVIVQGGTDVGVWCNKRDFTPPAVLSLRQIPELDRLELVDGHLEVGGSVTLHALESFIRTLVPSFSGILRLFGSPQIRHAGTLAGNIANASPIADTLPFLYVMEASVVITGLEGSRVLDIRSLFKGYKDLDMAPGELITRISIPLPADDDTLRLYKVSKRKDLDISTFTAALRMRRSGDRIESIRIAYGGVGPVVLRLPRTEEWLTARPITEATFARAGELARQEISPISDVRGSRDFRLTLAGSILRKFYHECSGEEAYA